MDDFARRLIKHLQTKTTHAEGEVSVLIVTRRVFGIEAAESLKERFRNHDARGGAIIDLTQIIKLRLRGILPLAPVPARGVAPNDATCFLQTAIWENQFRSN